VAPGEVGELIVTNLTRRLMPVIRLRTGDRARLVQAPCPCGSKALTIELQGRSDDMIRVAGANVFVSDLDRLVASHQELLSHIYQLKVSKRGVEDALEIVLETEKPLNVEEKKILTPQITKDYLNIAADLKHFIENGSLKNFELHLVDQGVVAMNAKTHKISRVIDTRFS
jgi:phenylacetate-coenzyme A ligase PaaK-like adenylate-forming protein